MLIHAILIHIAFVTFNLVTWVFKNGLSVESWILIGQKLNWFISQQLWQSDSLTTLMHSL